MRAVQTSILHGNKFRLCALLLTIAVIVTTVEGYAHGMELRVPDIKEIISAAITNHAVPQGPNAIYLTFPPADVSAPESDLGDSLAAPRPGTGEAPGFEFRHALAANSIRCAAAAAVSMIGTTGMVCRMQANAPINLTRCL